MLKSTLKLLMIGLISIFCFTSSFGQTNYCGQGGPTGFTDYYWKATNVGNIVTYTFHPIGRAIGGTACTINNSLGNFAMTQSGGDFTFSHDVGGNTTITLGFTYTLGTTGNPQVNTANNSHTYVKGTNCINFVTPSTAASNITFPARGSTTMTINCTSGDGSNRLIVMRAGSAVDFVPADGTSYTANTLFTGGSGLGASAACKVVYNGTSNSVAVTGLTASSSYYVTVYEFNGTTTFTKYLTAGASTANTSTFAAAPATSITLPAAAASFYAPATIPIVATATSGNSAIASVKYYANNGTTNTLVGTVSTGSSPYTFSWTGVAIGSYSLTTVATDALGSSTTSAPVAITVVTAPPAGYCGSGGSAGNIDYYWKATNAGNIVTYTFHPVGRAIGGTACTINNSLGNFAMTLSGGDFTFSHDVGGNISINLGFTYTLGTTGNPQTSTPNTTHNYQKGTNCIYYVTPTTAASNITFPVKGTTTMTINCTKGDGSDRLVVMRAGSAVDFVPADGTAYTANSIFTSGTALGASAACKVVYTGTSNTVNVTGLTANTLYYVTVYEFNGTTTFTKYLTAGAPTANTSTFASAPTVSLSSPTAGASYFTASSIPITATAATGTGTIASVQFYANNGTTNTLIGSGTLSSGTNTNGVYNFTWTGMAIGSYTITAVATDNQGSATTSAGVAITVSATPPAGYCGSGGPTGFTDYYWKATNVGNIVTYTFHPVGRAIGGTACTINNSLGNFAMTLSGGDFTFSHDVGGNTTITLGFTYTLGTTGNPQVNTANNSHTYVKGNNCIYYVTPTTAASNITFPVKGTTTMTINCTSGNGSDRLIVMRAGNAVDFVPADGSAYTANALFTAGTGLGASAACKVVYSGTSNTVNVTGLTANTLYYVTVYEFNGSSTLTKYLTAGAPTANTSTYASAPTVSLSSPTGGTSYFTASSIPITATAASSTGTIATVQFYANNGTTNSLIGSGSLTSGTNVNGVYNFTWTGMAVGSYTITAVATDNQGSATTSAGVAITVATTPPTNYCGSGGPTGFTDYYWKATNVGNIVTYTFHPVGRAIGGTACTINNSLGNFAMTKQANNDFTFSHDVGGNTTITLGFTYTLGTTGNPQTSSASTHTYVKGNNCIYFVTPSTAASNITFPAKGSTTFTINWTSGDGSDRLVVIRAGSAVDFVPVDGSAYTANPVFTAGSAVGTGCKVVYSGTSNTVDVSGLVANTLYYVTVYEFNGNTTYTKYLTTGAPVASTTTYLSSPTVSITSPANGASYFTVESVPVSATASSSTGTIASVQFYANDGTTNALIATVNSSPYNYTWSGMAAGSYAITAKATDNQGSITTSSAVNITVLVTPPDGYCGSGGPTGFTDYYWKATNVGNIVTYTFHPVGRAVGGTNVIINNSLGNFTMTKQANNDFTFSHDVGGNTTIPLGFTYTLGTTGNPQASTPNNTHTYVKGNNCVYCPASSSAVLSGTAPMCFGSSANIYVAITGGVPPYTVVYNNGTTNVTVNNYVSSTAIPVSPTVTTSYTLVSVAGDCGTAGTGLSGGATITVNPTPSISNQTSVICDGSAFTVSPSGAGVPAGTTYTWTAPTYSGTVTGGSAQSTGQTLISQILTNSGTAPGTATYTVTPKAGNCTGSTFTITVTVNPTPLLSSTLTPAAICSGTTLNYTATSATTGTTYTWTRATVTGISNASGSGGSATISEVLTNTTAAPVSVVYVYTLLANSCSNTQSVTVTVNPKAILSSSLIPPSLCSGTTFSYTATSATPGTTFMWSRAGVAGISNPASNNNTTNPVSESLVNTTTAPVDVVYAYSLSANGCNNSQNVTVTVNPNPVLTSTLSPADVCSGSTFIYTATSATPGATFSWTRAAAAGISNVAGSGNSGSVSESLINTTTAPADVIYVFTTSANGCMTSQNVTVTINPVPVVSNQTASICNATAFSLTPNGVPTGTTYSWTAPSYSSGFISGGANQSAQSSISETLSNSGTTAGTATYTITPLSGACTGSTFTVTVTVNPEPVVSNQTATTCSGVAFNVTPTSVPTGTTYSWAAPLHSGFISGSSAQSGQSSIGQTLSNSHNVPETATYSVLPVSGSCTGNPFTVIVTVNPLPIPTFTTAPGGSVCSSNDVTYTTESGMSGYVWAVQGTLGTDYSISSGGLGGASNTVTLKWLTSGSKTVTVSYTNTNSCIAASPASATTTVTLKVAPSVSIAITSGNNPSCQGGSLTFTATPTNGGSTPTYQWYKNTVLVPGVSGNAYTVVAPASVYAVLTTSLACYTVATATSNTISVTTKDNSWTGAVSTNWSVGANWCSGTVPVATSNIVLLSGLSRYPVLAASSAVNDIEIQAGATLDMNDKQLTVSGIVEGAGNFSGTQNSSLIITTNGPVGTLNFNATKNGMGSFIISGSGASATLGNALNVFKVLNVASNTLAAFNFLTLKSTINGTSSVAPITGGGSITGNVTVERYIPLYGHRAWRMLSVPTAGSQTIKQAWQENQAPMANGNPGYGTLLTNTTGGNGYDAASAGNSLLTLVPGNPGSFTGVASTNSPIATTSGYMLYMRGDRAAVIIGGPITQTATTLRTNGILYQGTQSAITVGAGTNKLIGNVYASAIDFANITKSGINSFKVWDPKLAGTSGIGAYQTFSSINGYDPTPGGGSYGSTANSRIESGQAFIVSSTGGGSLTLTEAAKTSGSNNFVFRQANTMSQLKMNLYATDATGDKLTDGATVVFDNGFENNVDENDAIKVKNMSENLGIQKSTSLLAIEARQNIVSDDTIYLQLSGLSKRQYRLDLEPKNMNTSVTTAYVEDKFMATKTQINLSKTAEVFFVVNADPRSAASDRFRIVFKKEGLQAPVKFNIVKANRKNEKVEIGWNISNEASVKQYDVERSTDGKSFESKGTLTAGKAMDEASYTWVDENPAAEDVYYRIKSTGYAAEAKYTNVAKVGGSSSDGFAVSPNPVTGSVVMLELKNHNVGTFKVRFLNNIGQPVFQTSFVYNGELGNKKINLDSKVINGAYQLQLTDPIGKKSFKMLVVSNGK